MYHSPLREEFQLFLAFFGGLPAFLDSHQRRFVSSTVVPVGNALERRAPSLVTVPGACAYFHSKPAPVALAGGRRFPLRLLIRGARQCDYAYASCDPVVNKTVFFCSWMCPWVFKTADFKPLFKSRRFKTVGAVPNTFRMPPLIVCRLDRASSPPQLSVHLTHV